VDQRRESAACDVPGDSERQGAGGRGARELSTPCLCGDWLGVVRY
jgi:hypothetical protein